MASDNNDELLWGWQSKTRTVAERGKHILGTDAFSDVTFRVGSKDGETIDIKAHKVLLAMGSSVFETMFYGNLPETQSIIPITDIDPESFTVLLRYLYHDQVGPFDATTAFPTLYAAKKYGLPILKDACEEYLRAYVSAENCLAGFVQAKMCDEPKLAEFFLLTIDAQGPLVLKSADFLEVDIGTLKEILSRDSLKVREVDVYHAALQWATHRCAQNHIDQTGTNLRAALGDALYLIRFPIMTCQEVALGPARLGMLVTEEVYQLFQFWYAKETLPGIFIAIRHLSAELHIERFAGKQDGWPYVAGRPNGIRLCITSVTDKTNQNVVILVTFSGRVTNPHTRYFPQDWPSINLVAVGLYLSSEIITVQQRSLVLRPVYNHPAGTVCVNNTSYPDICLFGQPYFHQYGQHCPISGSTTSYYCRCPQPSPPEPTLTISLKVYIEEGANQRELDEHRQTFSIPNGQAGDHVQKMALSKAIPLKMQQQYTISVDITGIQQCYSGTVGKSSVTMPTSSGDLNVTVQFSSATEGNAGSTSVAQGQFPEFYLAVIG